MWQTTDRLLRKKIYPCKTMHLVGNSFQWYYAYPYRTTLIPCWLKIPWALQCSLRYHAFDMFLRNDTTLVFSHYFPNDITVLLLPLNAVDISNFFTSMASNFCGYFGATWDYLMPCTMLNQLLGSFCSATMHFLDVPAAGPSPWIMDWTCYLCIISWYVLILYWDIQQGIFSIIYRDVRIQPIHFFYGHCENGWTLSYYHHQIWSMTHLPLFRARLAWKNGTRRMSFYIMCLLIYTHTYKWIYIYTHIYIYIYIYIYICASP